MLLPKFFYCSKMAAIAFTALGVGYVATRKIRYAEDGTKVGGFIERHAKH